MMVDTLSIEEHMIPEVRERIARLEVKLDYVISNMTSLPPSPATLAEIGEVKEMVKEHNAILVNHGDFIKTLKERIAWVAAAFSAIISISAYGAKWLFENININWGGHG